MPYSPLADTVTDRLPVVYAAAAEPGRAVAMRAYTRDVAPFLGLTTPVRRGLSRTVLDGLPRPGEADRTAIALRCRRLPEREYHYCAVDLPRRHVTYCSSGFLPVVRHLLTTVPRWDTVDLLAAHAVGGLVAADRGLTAGVDARIVDDDLWLVRTALLHHRATGNAPTPTASSATACAGPATPTSSSARPSAGACTRTRRPPPAPYAPSRPRTGRPSPRCPRGRRCGTPVRSAGAGAASIELPCHKKAFDVGQSVGDDRRHVPVRLPPRSIRGRGCPEGCRPLLPGRRRRRPKLTLPGSSGGPRRGRVGRPEGSPPPPRGFEVPPCPRRRTSAPNRI